MKNLKILGAAGLAAVCAFGLVSCDSAAYTEYEKTARTYIKANENTHAQFDVSGNNFKWSTTAKAVAYGCERYEISYDFKTDKGTLYMKSTEGNELKVEFTYTYNWEYDAEADTEEIGPSTYEITKYVVGSEELYNEDVGFQYGELLAVDYKLEGTAIIAVQAAYAAATAEAAE